jgi:hypothetical protein
MTLEMFAPLGTKTHAPDPPLPPLECPFLAVSWVRVATGYIVWGIIYIIYVYTVYIYIATE